jgi:lysophospholipase L1-like esterase
MTITLNTGSTVLFTGDSITGLWRPPGEDRASYTLQAAGRWCFDHPDRPMTWLNTGYPGNTSADLEARWQTDVLDLRPDVVSILVGINDVGSHTFNLNEPVVTTEELAATYDRLLAPLADARLILVEPFLVPIRGVVEAEVHAEDGPRVVLIGEAERKEWRAGLDPKIQVVHELARRYGAELLLADQMFAELSAQTDPGHWSEDGVHLTPAGHSALAEAWSSLVS